MIERIKTRTRMQIIVMGMSPQDRLDRLTFPPRIVLCDSTTNAERQEDNAKNSSQHSTIYTTLCVSKKAPQMSGISPYGRNDGKHVPSPPSIFYLLILLP
jgi:hypothetical protein